MTATPEKTVSHHKRRYFMLLSLLILTILIGVSFIALRQARGASLPSPLLFGTNLNLQNASDPFLTDATLRSDLQQVHTQIIRIPTRTGMPESVVHQAAQYVHDMGLTPLIILGGQTRANPISDDTPVIQDMNGIFGNSRVYYEFGNEEDLAGVSSANYTDATSTSWNTVVSQLKPLAHNGWFIGPVNYQYNDTYLRYFLQHANPRPDAVSWHMYTCDTSNGGTASSCLAAIDNWPQHFSDARTAMHQTLGGTTELPILITEWNYDPHTPQLDNNSSFIQQWTTKAIETMANNNIFASMQYAANILTPLVNNNQITTQGTTFKSEYEKLIGSGPIPTNPPTVTAIATGTPLPTNTPTATVTGTPTNPPTPTAIATGTPISTNTPIATATSIPAPTPGNYKFSFEDGGGDGWSRGTSTITSVNNSTTVAKDGTHSLQVSFTGSTNWAAVAANDSAIAGIGPGQKVTAYIYVPSGNARVTAKLYVQDQHYPWHTAPDLVLTAGTWNLLTLTVPSMPTPTRQLGVQLYSTSNCTIYIDAVNWS